MRLEDIRKAASDAYVQGYGDTMMRFGPKHEQGIAAVVEAVAPILLAEPSDAEKSKVAIKARLMPSRPFLEGWTDCVRHYSDRLAAVIAKPDPLREALSRWVSEADMDAAVAAVDAARGAK